MQQNIYNIDFYDIGLMLTNALEVINEMDKIRHIFKHLSAFHFIREYPELKQEFLQFCYEEFDGAFQEQLKELLEEVEIF